MRIFTYLTRGLLSALALILVLIIGLVAVAAIGSQRISDTGSAIGGLVQGGVDTATQVALDNTPDQTLLDKERESIEQGWSSVDQMSYDLKKMRAALQEQTAEVTAMEHSLIVDEGILNQRVEWLKTHTPSEKMDVDSVAYDYATVAQDISERADDVKQRRKSLVQLKDSVQIITNEVVQQERAVLQGKTTLQDRERQQRIRELETRIRVSSERIASYRTSHTVDTAATQAATVLDQRNGIWRERNARMQSGKQEGERTIPNPASTILPKSAE